MSDQIELPVIARCIEGHISSGSRGADRRTDLQPGFMTGLSGIGLGLLDNEFSRPVMRILLSTGLLEACSEGTAAQG